MAHVHELDQVGHGQVDYIYLDLQTHNGTDRVLIDRAQVIDVPVLYLLAARRKLVWCKKVAKSKLSLGPLA